MKPILYPADETTFDSNGIGILSDAIDCTVIETLNSKYELELKYPVSGIHFKSIRQRTLIMAKPDPVTEPQPFRVYRITKPMDGQVTIYARHLVYDLMGVTVVPFSAAGVVSAMQAMKTYATTDCPFTFYTDMSVDGTMAVEVPTPVWTLLGSSTGSILDIYSGEYEFDNYLVHLLNRRGADRGVSIRYGKNLTSLEQDENCADCYTAVHPYWKDSEGKLVQLSEKVVQAAGNHGYVRVMPLDCSQQWGSEPTETQLRKYAEQYITDNNIGVPKTSWKIEFVQLEQSEEYKGKALLERVLLGDTVSVDYADLDVSATARVNEVRYKPLLERYESVTLGDVKTDLADTLVNQQRQLKSKSTQTQMQIAIQALTSAIIGAKGGAVRLLDDDGDGYPDTLYIADDPDPEKAVKVWRFNYEGWGASKNGYNGPFILGASFDSGFLADFITAGTLNASLVEVTNLDAANIKSGYLAADRIKAGTLSADKIATGIVRSVAGNAYFDLDSGIFYSSNGVSTIKVSGGSISVYNSKSVKIFEMIADPAYSGDSPGGAMYMYDETGALTLGLRAADGKLLADCYHYDNQSMMGGKLGLRTVNGVNVLGLY